MTATLTCIDPITDYAKQLIDQGLYCTEIMFKLSQAHPGIAHETLLEHIASARSLN
jgi:hypothetical protein